MCTACAVPLSDVVALADGAREALAAVRAIDMRLVICSNTFWRGDEDARRDWEEGFQISFDGYVTSRDTGYGKPHPAIFRRALQAVAAAPSRAAIIGDQVARDIAGGRAVGLRTIWMRHRDEAAEASPAPDATVTTWREVPAVIIEWRDRG